MLTAMPKAPVMLSRKDAAIVQSAGPIAFLQQSAMNGYNDDSDGCQECEECEECEGYDEKTTAAGDNCDDCAVCKSESTASVQPSRLDTRVSFDPSINLPFAHLGFGPGKAPKKFEPTSTIADPALLSDIMTTKPVTQKKSKPIPQKKSKPATIPEDMDRAARLAAWKDQTRAYLAGLPPAQQAEVANVDCMQRLMSPETFDPQQQARWLASLPVQEQKEIAEVMPDATVQDLRRQAQPATPAVSFPEDLKDELTAITQMCETAADLKDVLDVMQAAPATFLPPATRFQLRDSVMFKTEDGVLEGEVVQRHYREAAEDGKMVTYKIRCQGGECYYAIDDGDDLVWGKAVMQGNDSSDSSSESDDSDEEPFVPTYAPAPYAMSRRCIMPSHMQPFFPPPPNPVPPAGDAAVPMYVQTPVASQQTRPAQTGPLMYMPPQQAMPPYMPAQPMPPYMPTQPAPPQQARPPYMPAQQVPPPAAPQPQNGMVYMPAPPAQQVPPAQMYRHCAR